MDPLSILAITSGVSGAANFGSGLLNSYLQRKHETKLSQMNIQAALDQTNLANKYNLDMWNRQNEYNLPAAQMARLQAAGLNPNLIYGSGAEVGNARSQAPDYATPHLNHNYSALVIPALDFIDRYQDVRLKQAQVNQVEENTRLTAAREIESKEKLAYLAKQSALLAQKTLDLSTTATDRYKNYELRNQALKTLNSLRATQTDYQRKEYELFQQGFHRNAPWWSKKLHDETGRLEDFINAIMKKLNTGFGSPVMSDDYKYIKLPRF